jgi:hypothetical protein
MTSRSTRALACAVLFVAALVLLSGCGASSSSTASSSASPSAAPGTPLEVTETMSDAIIKGEFDAGSMTLVKAASVQSEDAPGYYFVALKFSGPEGEQVGVWATKYLDAGGMIWAVNDVAQNYTQWPPSDSTGAKLTMETQGAQVAADAVQ